jgi:hypothetical protein
MTRICSIISTETNPSASHGTVNMDFPAEGVVTWWENLRERDQWGDPGVDGRIILGSTGRGM